MDLIRVFIGSETKTRVPERVLEHSIRRRTESQVEVTVMGDYEPWLTPEDVHSATGFSLRRWMIPEYCNFSGKAIYLDADQIVLDDIQNLWKLADGESAIHCTFRTDKCSRMLAGDAGVKLPQTSVMLLDCDRCDPERWCHAAIYDYIRKAGKPHSGKKVVQAYQYVMHGGLAGALNGYRVAELPQCWNQFNECPYGTRLLHYTFEDRQPWYNPGHELSDMWEKELASAIEAGFVCRGDLEEALAMGKYGSQDRRKFGGMHKHWAKMLELCP